MKKRAMKSDGRSKKLDGARAGNKGGAHEPVADLMGLLRKVSGTVLGGMAVGAQVGNVLICLFMIFVGPAFILGLLSR